MKKASLFFVTLQALSLLSVASAVAGEDEDFDSPITYQKVFNVHVDLTPSRLLPVPANRIYGDVPLRVLNDSDGRIVGLQLGDADTKFTYEMNDGTAPSWTIEPTAVSRDLLTDRKYLLQLKVPVLGKRELLDVDGSQLDPVKGGPIKIRYVASPIFGTTHDTVLQLEKINGKWVASTEKSYVSGAEVNTDSMGLGFSKPRFTSMDPNELTKSMQVVSLADPRQASDLTKTGKELLDVFERRPANLGYGVEFSLTSSAVGAH